MAHQELQPMRSTSRRNSAAYPTNIATMIWDAPAGNANENSMTQMITSIRNEDMVFNKAVSRDKFSRGDVVATSGEMARKMFVLMTGRVHLVCTNNEGRRLVIATLEPGAIFGEGALDNPTDPTVFAEAATNSQVWTIPASEARNMTMRYPILGWGMLQTYGQRLMQVENSLEDVAYKKLPERLASLLMELGDYSDGLIKGVSHQSLADRLGTYRETVSAILRDFKRQGLVELGYRRITVLDALTLKDIAGIWA